MRSSRFEGRVRRLEGRLRPKHVDCTCERPLGSLLDKELNASIYALEADVLSEKLTISPFELPDFNAKLYGLGKKVIISERCDYCDGQTAGKTAEELDRQIKTLEELLCSQGLPRGVPESWRELGDKMCP